LKGGEAIPEMVERSVMRRTRECRSLEAEQNRGTKLKEERVRKYVVEGGYRKRELRTRGFMRLHIY